MTVQDQKRPAKGEDLAKRLSKLVAGRSIARVLRADAQEMALELDDGSRIFARVTAEGMDISVT
ncbi:MAG: hypothetical protein ABUS48_02090 [Pseudomonadota bacterium]